MSDRRLKFQFRCYPTGRLSSTGYPQNSFLMAIKGLRDYIVSDKSKQDIKEGLRLGAEDPNPQRRTAYLPFYMVDGDVEHPSGGKDICRVSAVWLDHDCWGPDEADKAKAARDMFAEDPCCLLAYLSKSGHKVHSFWLVDRIPEAYEAKMAEEFVAECILARYDIKADGMAMASKRIAFFGHDPDCHYQSPYDAEPIELPDTKPQAKEAPPIPVTDQPTELIGDAVKLWGALCNIDKDFVRADLTSLGITFEKFVAGCRDHPIPIDKCITFLTERNIPGDGPKHDISRRVATIYNDPKKNCDKVLISVARSLGIAVAGAAQASNGEDKGYPNVSFLSAYELSRDDADDDGWLCQPLGIRKGRVTLLYSEEKTGKSTALRQWQGASLRGEAFMQSPTVPMVFRWFGEESQEDMRPECERWWGAEHLESDLIKFAEFVPQMSIEQFAKMLIAEAEKAKTDSPDHPFVAVIDTLTMFTNDILTSDPNQNSATEGGAVVGRLKKLTVDKNITVVFCHHSVRAKDRNKDYRGSGQIGAGADILTKLERDDETGKIHITKKGRRVGQGKEAWMWDYEIGGYVSAKVDKKRGKPKPGDYGSLEEYQADVADQERGAVSRSITVDDVEDLEDAMTAEALRNAYPDKPPEFEDNLNAALISIRTKLERLGVYAGDTDDQQWLKKGKLIKQALEDKGMYSNQNYSRVREMLDKRTTDQFNPTSDGFWFMVAGVKTTQRLSLNRHRPEKTK